MRKKIRAAILSGVFMGMAGAAIACGDGEWGYSGAKGPDRWGYLKPEWAMCRDGKNQTPIDIVPNYQVRFMSALVTNYRVPGNLVTNKGTTIQVDFPEGNYMRVGQKKFYLRQVHFHSPSENHLNGKSFPLEAHFVHSDVDGNLAVLGVFYEEGAANPGLETIWRAMPRKRGESRALPRGGFAPNSIVPASRQYIYFNGSLTTPPCTEGVGFHILTETQTISAAQTRAFFDLMGGPTNRPLQPVNARRIISSK